MKVVFKYPIPFRGPSANVMMPKGAEILTLQMQDQVPCIWALVDPAAPLDQRHFKIRGTGHPWEGDGKYIGTFQIQGGAFVFHVFESVPEYEAIDR